MRVTTNTVPQSTPSVASGNFVISPTIPTITSSLQVIGFSSESNLQSNPGNLILTLDQSGTSPVQLSVLMELEHDGQPAWNGTRSITLNGATGQFDASQFVDFATLNMLPGYTGALPAGTYTVRVTTNTVPQSTPSVAAGSFTIAITTPTLNATLQLLPFPSFNDLSNTPSAMILRINQSGTESIPLVVEFLMTHGSNVAGQGSRLITLDAASGEWNAGGFIDFVALTISPDYAGLFPSGIYSVAITVRAQIPNIATINLLQQFSISQGVLDQPAAISLISPPDHSVITLLNPVFEWTRFDGDVVLRLVEVMEGQNASQAIQANVPLIEQRIASVNYLYYESYYPSLVDGAHYAWHVTGFSQSTVGNNIAVRSEIASFSVMIQSPTRPGETRIEIIAPTNGADLGENTSFEWRPIGFKPPCYTVRFWEQRPGVSVTEILNTQPLASITTTVPICKLPVGIPVQSCHYYIWQVSTPTISIPGNVTTPSGSSGTGTTQSTNSETDCIEIMTGTSTSTTPTAQGKPGTTAPRDPTRPPTVTVGPPFVFHVTWDACVMLDISKDKGAPVSLGIMLDDPGTFKYPRAVPIRGTGKDMDYIIFKCAGCSGGVSELRKPLVDEIVNYTWVLSGKGSLNSPFSAQQYNAAQDKIEEIRDRLHEIEEKITEHQKRKTDVEANAKDTQGFLDQSVAQLKSLAETVSAVKDSLAGVSQEIVKKNNERLTHAKELKTLEKDRDLNEKQLKDIQDKLDGKPVQEELNQLKQIEGLHKSLEALEQKLKLKLQEILDRSTQLQDQIATAQLEAQAALQAYDQIRMQAEAQSKIVAQARSALFSHPAARHYYEARADWNGKLFAFATEYCASDLQQIASQQAEVNSSGVTTLSASDEKKRLDGLTAFRHEIAITNTQIAHICDTVKSSKAPDCKSAAYHVKLAGVSYDSSIQRALKSGYIMNPSLLANISSAQNILGQMEKAVRDAAALVEQKNAISQNAVSQYVAEMKKLEQDNISITDQIVDKKVELTSAETALESMVRTREQELESNRDAWQLSKQSMEQKKISYTDDIGRHAWRLEQLDDTLTGLQSMKLDIEERYANLLTRKKDLEQRQTDLKKSLAALTAKAKEIAAEIEKLEEERKDLEGELEKANEELKNINQPATTAAGQLVYYIPPPLEEIMKRPEEFAALKDSVIKAEAELLAAREFNIAVQMKLLREYENIAGGLISYRNASILIDETKEKIDELTLDLGQKKTESTMDYQDDLDEAQQRISNAEAEKLKAEQYRKQAEADSVQLFKEVATHRQERDNADNALMQFNQNVKTLEAQYDYEEVQLKNINATVKSLSDELRQERKKLNDLQTALAAAREQQTRAAAKEDQQLIESANSAAATTQSALAAQKTKVEALEQQLNSARASQESATLRVRNATKALQDIHAEYVELQRKLKKAADELFHANEEYNDALSQLNHWRKITDKAEEIVDRMNEKKKEAIEKMQSSVNEQSGAEDAEASIEALEQQIKELEAKKGKTVEKGSKAAAEKESIVTKAEERYANAKKALADAKEKLRAFLVEEFNAVNISASLELKANDKPADGWRTGDGSALISAPIVYPNDRTPVLASITPSASLPQVKSDAICIPSVEFLSIPDPNNVPPRFLTPEPRTIALLYKNGEPLWPEWPVITESLPVLAKDVVQLVTSGGDGDQFVRKCTPLSPNCSPIIDPPKAIVDIMTYAWTSDDGRYINGAGTDMVFWEPGDVKSPDCIKPMKFETKYIANGIAPDPVLEDRNQHEIKPGVLIEVPDALLGSPKEKVKVRPRIVKGDHSGLVGETVEFVAELKEGAAEKWGFDGKPEANKVTIDGGYAEAEFDFGEGFAKYQITVRWKRGDETCEEKKIEVTSPLYLKFLKAGAGSPAVAWDAAKSVWEGGGFKEQADAFLAVTKERDDDDMAPVIEGVVGLHDEEGKRIDDIEIMFSRKGGKVDPEKGRTALFGIARTLAVGVKEDETVVFTAKIEKQYEKVTRPPEVSKEARTDKLEKFRIGIGSDLFVVRLDEPVERGAPINGTGRLEIAVGGAFDNITDLLKDIELTIDNVTVADADEEEPTATDGIVSWKTANGLQASLFGFEVTLKELGITCDSGAIIAGTIKPPALPVSPDTDEDEVKPTAVSFSAEMNLSGDFYGSVSELPKCSFRGFRLKEGSSFILDMHSKKSATGFVDDFHGVVVRTAELELPKIFRQHDAEKPASIVAEDLGIGKFGSAGGFGIQGTISLEGSFFKLGYAGYDFEAQSVKLTFKDGNVDGAFGGRLALPVPFEGTLALSIEKSGDEWGAKISTTDPVSIPRLRTVFTLLPGTGISYDVEKNIGTLAINAIVATEKLGTVTISGFEAKSNGEIVAKKISIGKSIKFMKGFDFMLDSLSFASTAEEYSIELNGAFGFPIIQTLEGFISIKPGPVINAGLKKVQVSFEKPPVEFTGKLEFGKSEFRGEFDIGIQNLAQKSPGKGISGMLIFGTQPVNELESYAYWYAEMILRTSILLGQTGLSLLELGGGLGYNFDPPIGSQNGTPRFSESFSLKAMIGVGNTPGGEIFAGRTTLALTNQKFSVNGKLWLLSKEDALFGEGQLNLYWNPAKLDGFVQMYIGLPTAAGNVFRFKGKVNYEFASLNSYSIKSEEISGAVFNALKAEGKIQVDPNVVLMNGNMWYNLNKTYPFGIVDVKVQLDVAASGGFEYMHKNSTLTASADFKGAWDVNIDTPAGEYDLISGSIALAAQLAANKYQAQFTGSAYVSWDILWYSDSASLDFGFTVPL